VCSSDLFLVRPVLYNDLFLLKLGFFNSGGKLFEGIGILIIIILLIYLIFRIFRSFLIILQNTIFGKFTFIFLSLLGIMLVINTLKSGATYEPQHVFQEPSALILNNSKLSFDSYRGQKKISLANLKAEIEYEKYTLKKKPNLYVLFFESYGKVLFTHNDLKDPYLKCLKNCQDSLTKRGWNIASSFSISPVSGGNSWISYSTFMLGFKVQNEGEYLFLLKNEDVLNYDHFFRLFGKKGYTNYRLNSMPENENLTIPWGDFTKFYDCNHWILNKDFEFHGRGYGFGPSPPDQYSLFFANDYIHSKNKEPYTLFFINQNSHHPFFSPDSIVNNWKLLNNKDSLPDKNPVFLQKPQAKDYLKSVKYDLMAFTQFILKEGKENDIFIIIGDHQPPVITLHNDGFETPVHIISRDSSFVEGFLKYGFEPGLQIHNLNNFVRHEGLYSMFMLEFLRQYATDTVELPEYKPNGLF
jgi:hypothetical protein